MARVAAIDFGLKRTGIAISDPLAMIANGLDTVSTQELMVKLKVLHIEKPFDRLVVGYPKRLDGSDFEIERNIKLFIDEFAKQFPSIQIARLDERFTSKIAAQTLSNSGVNKSNRRNKETLDKISATLLLQEYLNRG
ncbi:MAG: Holliday junction resolvase RuvX [Flavobacteriales bacterium]